MIQVNQYAIGEIYGQYKILAVIEPKRRFHAQCTTCGWTGTVRRENLYQARRSNARSCKKCPIDYIKAARAGYDKPRYSISEINKLAFCSAWK